MCQLVCDRRAKRTSRTHRKEESNTSKGQVVRIEETNMAPSCRSVADLDVKLLGVCLDDGDTKGGVRPIWGERQMKPQVLTRLLAPGRPRHEENLALGTGC